MPSSSFSTTILVLAAVAWVTLVRVLVGYQPHSGQDNYQGPSSSTVSDTTDSTDTRSRVYGGDYEAQRHWMELTLHLPIQEWYYYDTPYWGLDYPPLTAYHSYICGYICHFVFRFVDAVALDTSRGYESPLHKAYMRSTVLVSDLLCYGTVIAMLVVSAAAAATSKSRASSVGAAAFYLFLYSMMQPAILLIDHGHFQYNTVALGLALWSIYFMTKIDGNLSPHRPPTMKNCIFGSIFFCCALSFKQMTLYYAPPIFFYLLGRCFATTTSTPFDKNQSSDRMRSYLSSIVYRFAALGITVLVIFTLLWWPFIVHGPSQTTYMERAKYMFERIIPIRRGLFEGKVSNIWCALSVSPFRIRQRIPTSYQPVAALLLTLVLLIPSSIHLFNVGRQCHQNKFNQSGINYYNYDRQQLLWGATNSALAFFLASFQVHEKSLLLALAPCSLLLISFYINDDDKQETIPAMTIDSKFVNWFSIVTVWTLWPLLQIDRLQTAYVCTIVLFISMIGLYHELTTIGNTFPQHRPILSNGFFDYLSIYHFDWIPSISYSIMILLHFAEYLVAVPEHLPDLFPVLWSIVGCGFCCLAYAIICWHMVVNRRAVNGLAAMAVPATKLKAI